MNLDDQGIKGALEKYRKIAVYGLSPDESKPSHSVPMFMRSKGFEIVGLYPGETEIKGVKIYENLAAVPAEYRRFVNVFRRSEAIPKVVDEVLAAGGCELLWLQLGIQHAEAEKRAEDTGLKVVSNRCLYIEYRKWWQ